MQQIHDPNEKARIPALWQLAFRAGFLAASGFAVVSIGWWLAWLEGGIDWKTPWSPNWWHAHEMLFGFAMPVVVGFLLTAVATWTGTPGSRGWVLQCLFGLWLVARLALLANLPWGLVIAATCDTLFILGAAVELGRRIWSVRQKRNYAFAPIMLLFATLNLLSYSNASQPLAATGLHYAVLLLFLLLIAVVGGRVIPFFTSRRLQQEQPEILPWLDFGSLALLGALVLAAAGGYLSANVPSIRYLLAVTAVFHLLRQLRWWSRPILDVPLLWSLHLSYLFIPLGLGLLAWSLPDAAVSKTVIHLLGIGAVSGMILAMISRVSLGHTGHALEVGRLVSASFALLALAALTRGLLPVLFPAFTVASWRISALLWIAAFVIFLMRYRRILSSPRPDGKPG
jgi:uncharacterized protein involved in response to NO